MMMMNYARVSGLPNDEQVMTDDEYDGGDDDDELEKSWYHHATKIVVEEGQVHAMLVRVFVTMFHVLP